MRLRHGSLHLFWVRSTVAGRKAVKSDQLYFQSDREIWAASNVPQSLAEYIGVYTPEYPLKITLKVFRLTVKRGGRRRGPLAGFHLHPSGAICEY